jgi:hypothetical protein
MLRLTLRLMLSDATDWMVTEDRSTTRHKHHYCGAARLPAKVSRRYFSTSDPSDLTYNGMEGYNE